MIHRGVRGGQQYSLHQAYVFQKFPKTHIKLIEKHLVRCKDGWGLRAGVDECLSIISPMLMIIYVMSQSSDMQFASNLL